MRRIWLRYMPVIPASASAAIRTFAVLRTASSVVVIEVDVKRGMADLDADEEHARGDRGGPGGPEEESGADRHVVLLVVGRAGCPAISRTVGTDAMSAPHHVM